MTHEERDRLTRLETEFEHINEKLDVTHKKVTEMHDLLMQARGARWFIVGMAAAGGFIASFLPKLIPFSGSLPK